VGITIGRYGGAYCHVILPSPYLAMSRENHRTLHKHTLAGAFGICPCQCGGGHDGRDTSLSRRWHTRS